MARQDRKARISFVLMLCPLQDSPLRTLRKMPHNRHVRFGHDGGRCLYPVSRACVTSKDTQVEWHPIHCRQSRHLLEPQSTMNLQPVNHKRNLSGPTSSSHAWRASRLAAQRSFTKQRVDKQVARANGNGNDKQNDTKESKQEKLVKGTILNVSHCSGILLYVSMLPNCT